MMKRRCFAGLVLAICIACVGCTSATEEGGSTSGERVAPAEQTSLVREVSQGVIRATVKLTPEKPVLGDKVTLELIVEADQDVRFDMPAFGDQLARFHIPDMMPSEKVDPTTGHMIKTQRYTLDLMRSGKFRLPSFMIEFTDNRPQADPSIRGKVQELYTEDVSFVVDSILPEGMSMDTLNPPRGPLDELVLPEVVHRQQMLIWGGVGLAGLAVLVCLLVWWFRRKRVVVVLPPHEVALNALTKLEKDGIPTEAQSVDAWYVKLSGIVRTYVEGRFSLQAPRLTTEEFFELAKKSQALDSNEKRMIHELLEHSDRVKFANLVPTPEVSREMLSQARQFVEQTKPVEETASVEPKKALKA